MPSACTSSTPPSFVPSPLPLRKRVCGIHEISPVTFSFRFNEIHEIYQCNSRRVFLKKLHGLVKLNRGCKHDLDDSHHLKDTFSQQKTSPTATVSLPFLLWYDFKQQTEYARVLKFMNSQNPGTLESSWILIGCGPKGLGGGMRWSN